MPKLKLTFHLDWDDDDPEGVVADAVDADNERAKYELTPREFEDRIDKAETLAWDCLGKFLENDCCLTVEFDTETGTARVLERTQ